MGSFIEKEEIKNCIKYLAIIRQHCSYESCDVCIFNDIEEPCMFFSQPYKWNLGELEEKWE